NRRTHCNRFAAFRPPGGQVRIADLPADKVTGKDLEEWLRHLTADRKLNPQTRLHHETSVRAADALGGLDEALQQRPPGPLTTVGRGGRAGRSGPTKARGSRAWISGYFFFFSAGRRTSTACGASGVIIPTRRIGGAGSGTHSHCTQILLRGNHKIVSG